MNDGSDPTLPQYLPLISYHQEHWARFKPVIGCPLDRELTRYGGEGDGSKLLCRVQPPSGQTCIIYSLGSNGM